MTKLWQKNQIKLNSQIEAFETGDDLKCDQKLIKFDVAGSVAQAKMLLKIGVLTDKELKQLEEGLAEILKLYKAGKFILKMAEEDMHTKIENYLTEKYGEVGKKIHTGRSRNDQILTALRLYNKSQLASVKMSVKALKATFDKFSKKYEGIPMPGYTHMQKAMPSSVSMWADSFSQSLADDLVLIQAAFEINDKSPLGSAAGYGVPINLERHYTAKLLGFKKVQENPIYCQNSRGKTEAAILAALISTLSTLNKFASDVLLFTTQEFGFFKVADDLTTGSSIMPQKRNVDIAELLKSKVHLVLGNYVQMVSLGTNLISGYNRDLQDSKKPVMEAFDVTLDSLTAAQILLNGVTPNVEKLNMAMTEDLFATQKALELVLKGESFRNAYQKIAKEIFKGGDTK